MPALSIGFEVHQPYRLNRFFAPDPKVKKKDILNLYFDEVNQQLLHRIAEKCYIPATSMILDMMDEGFSCSFSFSGTLIEQLEKWSPDALALFEQVATHRNAEILAQTYFHSIASCFHDKTEFTEQIRMHVDLMRDLFHAEPKVFENTEFTFNNAIASHIKDMGFAGIFTEGVDRILGWRSPNYLYTCRDIPVLLRNTQLSDDIAFRFTNQSWDQYPLTADTYARWVAQSPGEVVKVFLDYESFGEHMWPHTGIFEFLRYLPEEFARQGVPMVLPSQVLADYSPVGTIDVPETISWADIEKDTSAWMGNDRQREAFQALETARAYAKDKQVWRYLQTSDHFYYMALKHGSCGEVHSYFSYIEGEDAFRTYMRILADYEGRNIRVMKNRKAARTLRTLSPETAFHFATPAGYTGYTAYNLDQFCELLNIVPIDSIQHHLERGDFSYWIADVLNDAMLAERIKGCTERQDLTNLVCEWKEHLWSHLR
jgi:alpha-amylase